MKSCIVSLIEYQGTLPCLYLSKAQGQRGKVLLPQEQDGLSFPQPNGLRIIATRLDIDPGTCGGDSIQKQCFKRGFQQAGSSPVNDPGFRILAFGDQQQPDCPGFGGICCCLSAHMPSPGSANSWICPSGSDLLDHGAAGSLLLPEATSFPGEVSEPGKGQLRDRRGPYSLSLHFQKEAAGGARIFLAVPPNGLSQTLAEAQQSLSLDFPILL